MADNKITNTQPQVIEGCANCAKLKGQIYDLEKIKKDAFKENKELKATNEDLSGRVSKFEKVDEYRNQNVNPKFMDEAMKLEVDQDWKTSKSNTLFCLKTKLRVLNKPQHQLLRWLVKL